MKITVKIIVPLLILAGAFLLGKFLVSTKEEPKSQQPKPIVPVVDVITVSPADHTSSVISYGTVQSYFETTVIPQVTGKITKVSEQFKVGERVKKGELLATIDATDYQAALASQQANLALQQRALAEEKILAQQAAEDWVASGRKLTEASDFVLRKPQLSTAQANITSAEAAVDKAIIDIERTQLTAPYDAVVTARTASVGNLATPQVSLGTLIATEKAEIRLPLTAQQTARVVMPAQDQTSQQTISLTSPNNPGVKWSATLARAEPTVDPQNQVSYVIAEITNPYSGEKPLLVGTFVNAAIPALPITNAYEIPESALVNDSYVWLVNEEDKLLRASAARIHSHAGHVYVSISSEEITPPLRIISRPLSNFRAGVTVKPSKTPDQDEAEPKE